MHVYCRAAHCMRPWTTLHNLHQTYHNFPGMRECFTCNTWAIEVCHPATKLPILLVAYMQAYVRFYERVCCLWDLWLQMSRIEEADQSSVDVST